MCQDIGDINVEGVFLWAWRGTSSRRMLWRGARSVSWQLMPLETARAPESRQPVKRRNPRVSRGSFIGAPRFELVTSPTRIMARVHPGDKKRLQKWTS